MGTSSRIYPSTIFTAILGGCVYRDKIAPPNLTLFQNFGIIVAYGIAYTAALLFFTEVNTKLTASGSVVLFKQGSQSDVVEATQSDDVERASQNTAQDVDVQAEKSGDYEKALKETTATTDIFSWQNLTYTVPVADGKRRLLNEVSGFVAPGKLTALMGESGAGKVILLLQIYRHPLMLKPP